jgi:hypothetical protein
MRARKKEIPKDGAKDSIRDRVIHGALKLILEPISKLIFNRGLTDTDRAGHLRSQAPAVDPTRATR